MPLSEVNLVEVRKAFEFTSSVCHLVVRMCLTPLQSLIALAHLNLALDLVSGLQTTVFLPTLRREIGKRWIFRPPLPSSCGYALFCRWLVSCPLYSNVFSVPAFAVCMSWFRERRITSCICRDALIKKRECKEEEMKNTIEE